MIFLYRTSTIQMLPECTIIRIILIAQKYFLALALVKLNFDFLIQIVK